MNSFRNPVECREPINLILVNKKNKKNLSFCKYHWVPEQETIVVSIIENKTSNGAVYMERFPCKLDLFDIITDKNEIEAFKVIYE